jgi:8-oxo-dGTP pyrophosphatase MutT (NUDIX family)
VIEKLNSRIVYENKWMLVREDDIKREDGSTGIYGVVEKSDFALVVPFDGNGFYLVEQYRYPVEGRYIEFPQGGWEATKDADPAELARGELAEETGLRAGSLTYLGHLYEAYGYSNQGLHVFLATDLRQGPQDLTVEEADLRVSYFTVNEFRNAVLAGKVKDAATLAAYALVGLTGSR